MAFDYKGWLESADLELRALAEQRAELQRQRAEIDRQETEIQRKIAALTKSVIAIGPLVDENEHPEWLNILDTLADTAFECGMTNRVRAILQAAGQPMSPTQIRDQLQRSGFNLGAYSNALATIHTVLKRLVTAGDATQDGRTYRWAAKGFHKAVPFHESKSAPNSLAAMIERDKRILGIGVTEAKTAVTPSVLAGKAKESKK